MAVTIVQILAIVLLIFGVMFTIVWFVICGDNGPEKAEWLGREQALRDSFPDFYVDAVTEHDVDVIAAPSVCPARAL